MTRADQINKTYEFRIPAEGGGFDCIARPCSEVNKADLPAMLAELRLSYGAAVTLVCVEEHIFEMKWVEEEALAHAFKMVAEAGGKAGIN
jgi:hypothetical protein